MVHVHVDVKVAAVHCFSFYFHIIDVHTFALSTSGVVCASTRNICAFHTHTQDDDSICVPLLLRLARASYYSLFIFFHFFFFHFHINIIIWEWIISVEIELIFLTYANNQLRRKILPIITEQRCKKKTIQDYRSDTLILFQGIHIIIMLTSLWVCVVCVCVLYVRISVSLPAKMIHLHCSACVRARIVSKTAQLGNDVTNAIAHIHLYTHGGHEFCARFCCCFFPPFYFFLLFFILLHKNTIHAIAVTSECCSCGYTD